MAITTTVLRRVLSKLEADANALAETRLNGATDDAAEEVFAARRVGYSRRQAFRLILSDDGLVTRFAQMLNAETR